MQKAPQTDSRQTAQRVRVGLTGLALVLLLIGLASAVFRAVNREGVVTAPGGAESERVAEMANASDGARATDEPNEPLAELGVAPATVADGNRSAEPGSR